MANGDALLFIFSLIDGSGLLFLTVYIWVLPEVAAHGFIVLLQLFTWHPFLFLLNAIFSAWQIHRYVTKPSGSIGVYDPTEIHNRQQLKGYMREAMVKLGYHLIFFFIYLYSMILALVAD